MHMAARAQLPQAVRTTDGSALQAPARYISDAGTQRHHGDTHPERIGDGHDLWHQCHDGGTAYVCSSTTNVSVSGGDILALRYTQDNPMPIIRIESGTRC